MSTPPVLSPLPTARSGPTGDDVELAFEVDRIHHERHQGYRRTV
jgi:hypothetical protein